MRRTLLAAAVAFAALNLLPMAHAQTEIRVSTAAPDNAPLSDAFRMIKARMETKFPYLTESQQNTEHGQHVGLS